MVRRSPKRRRPALVWRLLLTFSLVGAWRDATEGVVLSERLLLHLDHLRRPGAEPLQERLLGAPQPAGIQHVELDHLWRQLGRVEECLTNRAL